MAELGVRLPSGRALPRAMSRLARSRIDALFSRQSELRRHLEYNCSHSYAITVALLGDAIASTGKVPAQPRPKRKETPKPSRRTGAKRDRHDGYRADGRSRAHRRVRQLRTEESPGVRAAGRRGALREMQADPEGARRADRDPPDRRFRSPRVARVAAGRGRLLGAVVRSLPHGCARAAEGRVTTGRTVLVVKVNTDELSDLGQRHNILSIPTLAVFAGGKEVARSAGARPADQIEALIRQSTATVHR